MKSLHKNAAFAKALLLATSITAGCYRIDAASQIGDKLSPMSAESGRISEEETCDLGVVQCGGKCESEFVVGKEIEAPVEISRIATSCECIHVVPSKEIFKAGERISLRVLADFSDDLSFTGRLRVDARCYDSRGDEVKTIGIKIMVDDQ